MTDVPPLEPDPTAHFIATHIARTAKKNPPQVEDLAWAISEVTLQTQTAGASVLTVTLIDPQWSLITSGFLDVNADGLIDEIDVEFPEGSGSWWRICMVQVDSVNDSPNLILTFEDRIVSYLRDKWGGKVIAPGATTRAQVIRTLVDEIGRGNLPTIGSLIRGGDRLCTFGGAGSTGQQSIEIGWASPTSHIQVQTGGDHAGTAGENFARFLRSLGCPTVAIPTGTKGSTHNPVGAAGH